MKRGRTLPRIVIELPLEAAPRVRCVHETDSDRERLLDWIRAHPAVHDLLHWALLLEAEAKAKERRAS